MKKRKRKIDTRHLVDLPKLATTRDLADWLEISPNDLNWFCNHLCSDQSIDSKASIHYVCYWVRKRSAGWRLIESPKHRLKSLQRKILDDILNRIPPHPLACGFCKNSNILDFVRPHVRRKVCLKMDLADFFTRITIGRVYGLFRAMRFSPTVSHRLAMLTTAQTNPRYFEELHPDFSARRQQWSPHYGPRHLPQGAPSSPAIANLCAFRLDVRLSSVARSVGGVHYTRYADDLLFSGNRGFARQAKRIQILAGAIAIEEGFQVNFRKTRIMPSSQRQKAGGVVLNSHPNFDRRDYDQLKATLYNCVKLGPASQNRDQHPNFRESLFGKINWVRTLNPSKAKKLSELFEQIEF